MDKTKLRSAVSERSKLILKEFNEDNLNYFLQESSRCAIEIFDQYVFNIFNTYTEGTQRIKDQELLLKFTDYKEGYQQSMMQWKIDNPIVANQQDITLPSEPTSSAKIKPGYVLLAGTAVATCLFVVSRVWELCPLFKPGYAAGQIQKPVCGNAALGVAALAIEALTILFTYRQNNLMKKSEKEKQQYFSKIESIKSELINRLTSDLESWLERGEDASNKFLNDLNLI